MRVVRRLTLAITGLSLVAFAPKASAQSELPTAAAPAALEPPALVTFVQAPFPAEALAQKLTADVLLRLDIGADGKVTAATVETPAGHGFDEAAREAALGFVFRPATRAGQAVPARILYRYSFTLTEAPAPREPALPPTARIKGHVHMGDSDAPITGARVTLRDAAGKVFTTATDADGSFGASDIPAGRVTIHVEAPGFLPWDGSELVARGESLEVRYRLRPPSRGMEVTIRGEQPDREVTKRTIERKELALVPGTNGDALRAIETMPGVARPPALSGMVIVRGSGPSGTHKFVDGTFVPNLYHFGGLTSVVPTEMIEAIDFFPGNFSAKYGRVTGGIMDVRLREMQHDGRYHGLAQVDFIDARVLLRGPVPLLPKWDFEIAGRRSHVDAWIGPLLEGGVGVRTAPVYYDWQAFAETKPTTRSTFRVGVFGADDRLAFVFKDAMVQDPGLGNSLTNHNRLLRFQALYRNTITDRLSVSGSAAVGMDSENIAFGAMHINSDYVPVTFRGELAYRLARGLTVRVGPDILYYHIKADIRATQPPDPGQPAPGPYSSQPLISYDATAEWSQPAGYAEVEWVPEERVKVLLGARADYFNRTERLDLSPRLNVRYDLHHDFPRTTLKGGIGLFYEPPEPVQVAAPFGNPDLSSNRATHYSGGFEQELSREVDLSVEGFYKRLSDVVVRVPTATGATSYANVGDGKVAGVETLLRWKPAGRFFGWVAYTLSRSTRHNGPGEPERLFEYDQTHILTLLGSYDLGRGWQLGGRFRYVSGNPYTPCLGGVLQAGAGVYACRNGPLLSARMPPFHQLDLRVDKTWKFQSWKLTSYLDVQNVYNRANPEAVGYNYNFTKTRNQSGLPIIPSLGIRGEF
jgi:TonB family protein